MMVSIKLSQLELSSVSSPSRLSSFVSAIFFAAPSALFKASVSWSNFWSDPLTIANSPDMPSVPANIPARAIFRSCESPLNFSRISPIISLNGFIFPVESVRLSPNSLIACADCFVGLAIRVNTALNEVPACSALIPASAIIPTATPTSSTEYPNAPARGATYLKV